MSDLGATDGGSGADAGDAGDAGNQADAPYYDSGPPADTGTPDAGPADCISGALTWWRGEQNATDEFDIVNYSLSPYMTGKYAVGRVGDAFDLDQITFQSLLSQKGAGNWAGTPFSMTGWVNPIGASEAAIFDQNGLQGHGPWTLTLAPDGQQLLHLHLAFGNFNQDINPTKVTGWTFFALTCSGTSLVTKVGPTRVTTVVPACDFLSNGGYQFGRTVNATKPFVGKLDELSFYGRALSEAEVDQIQANEEAGKKACRKK